MRSLADWPKAAKMGMLISLALAVCLSALAVRSKFVTKPNPKSIVAILTGTLPLPLAPENISTIPLYQVHLNLWGTLLSAHGKPGLAKLTNTTNGGTVYEFEILAGAKFSNGKAIESDDVIFSINRLIRNQENGHFNAKSVVKSIERISESRFTIHLKEPTPAFLFLLSVPEMGIVPKDAVDAEGKVIRYDITSGAYTVLGVPESAKITLVRNPYFQGSLESSPETVSIIFKRGAEAIIKSIDDERADFLELYESGGVAAFQEIKDLTEFSHLVTRPSYSIFATANAKRLSVAQRQALSRLVFEKRSQFIRLNPLLESPSNEILPPKTFASLGIDKSPNENSDMGSLPKSLKIAVHDTKAPIVGSVVEIMNKEGIKTELISFADLGESTDYDFTITGQGMNADFPEIEFYLSMVSPWAYILSSDHEKQMVSNALHEVDIKSRSQKLQRVGRNLLEDGRIIPLAVRSYAHVFRNGRLNIDQVTTYDGDIPFWRMQLQ